MKKKILASLLLSTVMVSQVAVLTTAHAETTDDKIAAQDNKISNLTAQQQEAQKQVDQTYRSKYQLFKLSNLTCKLKMIDYKQNPKNLRVRLQNFLKTLYLAMILWKNKLVVLKQMELQLATLIQL